MVVDLLAVVFQAFPALCSEHFVEVVALVVGRTAGPEVFAYELSLAAVDLDLAAVGLHDLLLGLAFGQIGGTTEPDLIATDIMRGLNT